MSRLRSSFLGRRSPKWDRAAERAQCSSYFLTAPLNRSRIREARLTSESAIRPPRSQWTLQGPDRDKNAGCDRTDGRSGPKVRVPSARFNPTAIGVPSCRPPVRYCVGCEARFVQRVCRSPRSGWSRITPARARPTADRHRSSTSGQQYPGDRVLARRADCRRGGQRPEPARRSVRRPQRPADQGPHGAR